MWSIFNGTLVNAVAVLLGGTVGVLAGGRLSERARSNILVCLGLITIWIGVDSAVVELHAVTDGKPPGVAARYAMVVVASLLVGTLLGTAGRLHDRLEDMGKRLHRRFGGGSRHSIAEGFLASSVIFCVGPLTLLGCLRNGAPPHEPGLLYIKSLLDAFCAVALAASLGPGVVFSVLTVLVFQGGMALAAYAGGQVLSSESVHLMSATGGLVLVANALLLLEIKRIPVADMVPSLFLPPLFIAAGTGVGLLPP